MWFVLYLHYSSLVSESPRQLATWEIPETFNSPSPLITFSEYFALPRQVLAAAQCMCSRFGKPTECQPPRYTDVHVQVQSISAGKYGNPRNVSHSCICWALTSLSLGRCSSSRHHWWWHSLPRAHSPSALYNAELGLPLNTLGKTWPAAFSFRNNLRKYRLIFPNEKCGSETLKGLGCFSAISVFSVIKLQQMLIVVITMQFEADFVSNKLWKFYVCSLWNKKPPFPYLF